MTYRNAILARAFRRINETSRPCFSGTERRGLLIWIPEVLAMGLEQAKRHFDLHHGGADGWITFARIENGVFRQWHFRPEEASAALSEWIGEDVYFSQNTFYRPVRRVENVRQLRALYVDVDFYMLNFSPEWVIGHMETFIFGERVPEPNLIIHSGRGFVVVWLIEPVPGKKALPLWQAVERHFAAQFRDIGGDPRATDAARVFRIAGSINSRNGAEVTVQFRHPYRYQLRQLQVDYLPELTPRKTKTRGRPRKIARLFSVHALHAARLRDLARLPVSYTATGPAASWKIRRRRCGRRRSLTWNFRSLCPIRKSPAPPYRPRRPGKRDRTRKLTGSPGRRVIRARATISRTTS